MDAVRLSLQDQSRHSALLERLSDLLLDGVSQEAAALRVVDEGATQGDVESAIRAILVHPLFKKAREGRVRLECRDWLLDAYASLQELRHAPERIDTATSINREAFFEAYYFQNRALYLPGVAAEWKALRCWTPQYLAGVCGSEIVEIMMGRDTVAGSEQSTAGSLRETMCFSDYLDLLYSGGRSNDYYLVARNRFFDRPRTMPLLEDLGPLEFVNTQCASADVRLWLGPAGTYTPLHYDARNNVLVQVAGVKTIRLIAPYYSHKVLQTRPWYAESDPGLKTGPDAGDPPQIRLRLNPGDALFLPIGWWHAVAAEDVSLTLSFLDFGVHNPFRHHGK